MYLEILDIIFIIIAIVILFSGLIMPWVNYICIYKLKDKVNKLSKILDQLSLQSHEEQLSKKESGKSSLEIQVPQIKSTDPLKHESGLIQDHASRSDQDPFKSYQKINLHPQLSTKLDADLPESITTTNRDKELLFDFKNTVPKQDQSHVPAKTSVEQQLGAKLAVWIGGIALVLAVFFLIKYSVEKNLLSYNTRVILGLLLGIALLYASNFLHVKPNSPGNLRICQSLAGSGVTILYIVTFAATILYKLIPEFIGLLGMGIITTIAVIMSLRLGAKVAIFGLVGGLITPLLLGISSVSWQIIFIYLYVIFLGFMIVINLQNWWFLAVPAQLGVILWAIICVIKSSYPALERISIYIGVFLLAISITTIITSMYAYVRESSSPNKLSSTIKIVNYLGVFLPTILIAMITFILKFPLPMLLIFGIMIVKSSYLAYLDSELYSFAPIATAITNLILLQGWSIGNEKMFCLHLLTSGCIYLTLGYFNLWHTNSPLLWGKFLGFIGILGFLSGYNYFRNYLSLFASSWFWCSLAIFLGLISLYSLYQIYTKYSNDKIYKQDLLGIFAGIATIFISIGLAIQLEPKYFLIAVSGEILIISWFNNHIDIKALRFIGMLLTYIMVILMLPQFNLLLNLIMHGLFEINLTYQETFQVIASPQIQFGIPAIMIIIASYFLNLKKQYNLVKKLDLLTVCLMIVTAYYLKVNILDPKIAQVTNNILERAFITNILFVYGIACLIFGRIAARSTMFYSGILLCICALIRIGYKDLWLYNPLWVETTVYGWPIFNSLMLSFGLPLIWTWLAVQQLKLNNQGNWENYAHWIMLSLLLALVSFNIRYMFQGANINPTAIATNIELYSYSIAWLSIGIFTLILGIIKRDKLLRYTSMGLILITVLKVFLYDISELQGLYRVFSFFGLGLSLIVLSWIYNRFVSNEIELK